MPTTTTTTKADRLVSGRARLHLLARDVLEVARWSTPGYHVGQFHLELAALCNQYADAVFDGSGLRGTPSAPPRHGKTELLGVSLPTLVCARSALEAKPRSVLYVTANAERARKVSRRVRMQVRRLHELTGAKEFTPGETWTQTEWETAGGFSWVSLGAGAATGGIGANLVILDDLIGSGATYRSPAKREAIWEAVGEDYLSRLMGGPAIHMETRRGPEDTTGRLLREFGDVWKEHVWRCYDEARGYLWPERYGEAWRASMPHLTDTSPVWRALYQQEPVPEGGTLIPPEWLTATYSESPAIARRLAERVVIGVDLASTGKTTSDHVGMVVLGLRGAYRDVLHVVRRRMPYTEARQTLRELCATWQPSAVVVELAANGDAIVDELAREIPGLRGERATRDKVARLTPFLPALAARQVRLPTQPEPWVGPFREELTGFSGTPGEPDDQTDALVWALTAAEAPAALSYAALGAAMARRR